MMIHCSMSIWLARPTKVVVQLQLADTIIHILYYVVAPAALILTVYKDINFWQVGGGVDKERQKRKQEEKKIMIKKEKKKKQANSKQTKTHVCNSTIVLPANFSFAHQGKGARSAQLSGVIQNTRCTCPNSIHAHTACTNANADTIFFFLSFLLSFFPSFLLSPSFLSFLFTHTATRSLNPTRCWMRSWTWSMMPQIVMRLVDLPSFLRFSEFFF